MNKKVGAILRHSFLWVWVLVLLVPVIFMFLTSLKLFRDIISGSILFSPTLRNYRELFLASHSDFRRLTLNSIITSVGTTLIGVTVASLAANSLTRFQWNKWVSGLIMGGVLFIYLLPPIIFIGPFYLLTRSLGVYDTPLAIIMGHTAFNLPLAVSMLYDFFADIPKELEEAAVVDGANRIQTFLRIVLPIARPGVAATAALVFIFSWREFMFALSMTSTPRGMTIPVGISAFVQEYNIRYGEMSAAAIFAMLPAVILFIFAQRNIVKGMTLGALKG
ncbi:MAG: carbohydrate ABC transporter permease [Chloroflexota bacterium]|nr:carbohydrate ABC transporter permease [Chloroflexota bacterium]